MRCRWLLCALLLTVVQAVCADDASDSRSRDLAVSDHPRQAIRQADSDLKIAFSAGDKATQLKALRLRALAYSQVEEVALLKADTDAGLVLARELNNAEAQCEFMGFKAAVAMNESRYTDAIALYDEAIAFTESNNLTTSRARLLAGKADVYLSLDRGAEALKMLQEAYTEFEKRNETLWMVSALSAMAGANKGDPKDPNTQQLAIDYYRRALAMISPTTNRYDVGTLYHNLGVAHAARKDYTQARSYFEKGVAIVHELEDPVAEAYLHYRLGQLDRKEDHNAKALVNLDNALPVFAGTQNTNLLLLVQLERARALAGLDRRKESLDALAKAKTFVTQLNTPNTKVSYHEVASEIYARFGLHEDAYREAVALRVAERDRSEASNAKLTTEMQTRFEVQRRESENAVLRLSARESEARRLALVLALILSFLLLGGLVFFLVRNMRESQRLTTLAMRDDLTDLPNRRSILEFGQLQFRRRRGSDASFCIALIDIDNFKSINDDFGHDRGDAVLVAFAKACQQQLRGNDRIGRFGGEEFLLVLPGSAITQIQGLFERLRNAVASIRVEGMPPSRRYTFSMGAVTVISTLDTLDGLIKRADEALYRAKLAGRDRLELADGGGTDTGTAAKSVAQVPAPATAWVATPEHQALMKYEAILNNASVGIAFTRDRVFQHANPALEEMFHWPSGGLAGQPGMAVWGSEEEYQEVGRTVGPMLAQGKSVEIERKMRRRDGELFWCRIQAKPIDLTDPAHGGTIWIIEDVTERRTAVEHMRATNEELEQHVRVRTDELAAANSKLQEEVSERVLAEEHARHLALHDALTGLPNRRLLQDRLVHALAQARRENWSVAVIFIDLDRFKTINDSLGHAVGDDVLREMAQRLKDMMRDTDTVSRIGGDEFVIVLPHVENAAEVRPIAAKIMAEISKPVAAGGRELYVTPSAGISISPDDGDDAHKLLSHADAAMYHAKAAGRRNFQFFAVTMSDAVQTRLRLENDLHEALARSQFELHYQPRVDLVTHNICGYEALLRWHHPVDGMIMPNAFIGIAEESGLIAPIGEWVINEACAQIRRWRDAGLPSLPVSVNLSARQFFDNLLPQRVADALKTCGLEPSLLELEITESALMENTKETMNLFADLKALGVKLSIDDFGTGFSSLAYLKRFHVDNLKIDHSFVRDIGTDQDDTAIVRAIIGLAKSLQLQVIAEGVETIAQLEFLSSCGCDEAQGFLFSEARPAAALDALMVSGTLFSGVVWPAAA